MLPGSHFVNRVRIVALSCILLIAQGCAVAPQKTSSAAPAHQHTLVERYLDAISQRDLLALTLYVTPDVEWYTVNQGERSLESSGREQLTVLLKQYFERYRVTRWRAERFVETGQQVAVIERSEWGNDSLESRTALGVFELDGDRIKRITYYLNGR
jgi:ketosteroid isomerase-like protein